MQDIFDFQCADVKLKSRKNESPFYLAAFYYIRHPQYKNATCIRELYYAGANIDEPNNKGLTPLQMAATFGHTPLAKWLLLKNASMKTTPDPYVIACSQGHQDTAFLIWNIRKRNCLDFK
nr:ankyrin repeat and KH domain-containing protein mask-like isoform X2 [Leptinotarsa decemlineata]